MKRELTTANGVYRFRCLANARGFQNRATKSMGIVMGDDGLFWVVTPAMFAKLLRGGYEAAI